MIHIARTVVRRAERLTVTLMKSGAAVSPLSLKYLNRLSDYFFALARVINVRLGVKDVEYVRSAKCSTTPRKRSKRIKMNVKQISVLAIFIALSTAGAFVKIPGIIGSVALDSFPSLLAACLLSPVAGAVVGGLGHLISAILGGMLLGPLHFIIMLEMTLLAWTFGILYRSGNKVFAALLFFIGNAFISPLPFIIIISWSFFVALIPSLTIATAINLGVALILLPRLTVIFQKMIMNEGTKE